LGGTAEGLKRRKWLKGLKRQTPSISSFDPGVAQHTGGEPAGRWGHKGRKAEKAFWDLFLKIM